MKSPLSLFAVAVVSALIGFYVVGDVVFPSSEYSQQQGAALLGTIGLLGGIIYFKSKEKKD